MQRCNKIQSDKENFHGGDTQELEDNQSVWLRSFFILILTLKIINFKDKALLSQFEYKFNRVLVTTQLLVKLMELRINYLECERGT